MLFAGDPPGLKLSPEIAWARVGEEAEQGWGRNFQPDRQSLPNVLVGREGRFFLRVYDPDVRLLDSLAFRYSRDLRRIEVNGAEYAEGTVLMPGETGYPRTEIVLVGADGSTRAPVLPPQAQQAIAPSGVIDVPAHPDADRVLLSLGSDAEGANIVLDLPRIWWRLEDGGSEPGDWCDAPLVMTREEFRYHAFVGAMLSVLSKRQSSVRAGFDDRQDQPYSRKIEDDRIAIPLAHFADHDQIDRRLHADAHFNVEWAGEPVTLIAIAADPMPEIDSFAAQPEAVFSGEEAALKWTTRNADDARVLIEPDIGEVEHDGSRTVCPASTTRYTLILSVDGADDIAKTVAVTVDSRPRPGERPSPRVMSPVGGWRTGKGFSSGELRAAGLTLTEAAERSIPIDRRRRTSHRANADAIRSMLDA